MARHGPCPHYKYPKKNLKYQKLSFWPQPNRKRERRERERERERERKAIFSIRFTGFRRLDRVRSRIKANLRDEGYAWIPESQDSSKVQGSGFHENREKVVSREITPFEVGFFSYSG